jgi:alkylation response protein AidB-like acyl-CoA dehydrogenase
MTFAYSPAQQALQARVRDAALRLVRPAAAAIDGDGALPRDLIAGLGVERVWPAPDPVSALLVVEELAAESAAVAAAVALEGQVTASPDLPGLRGFVSTGDAPVSATVRVALAGLALGIGRAALAQAIASLKSDEGPAGGDDDRPHWAMADAATELDAARLLALKAAQEIARDGPAEATAAMAQAASNHAARMAVEAAIRIVGPGGYRAGAMLERLTRDQRTVSLLTGTEEEPRSVVAAGILPQ